MKPICTYYVRHIRGKQLVAAWRVLIGVWGPRRWDMGPAALKAYMVPEIPPPNPWIDRPLTPVPGSTSSTAQVAPKPNAEDIKPAPRRKKVASRSLVRHVLRARIEASQALAAFMEELERVSPRVRVSAHLGHLEGAKEDGYVSGVSSSDSGDYLDAGAARSESGATTPGSSSGQEKRAFLEGREVINYLRKCGARIAHQAQVSDWAAAASSSDGEGHDERRARQAPDSDGEEVVWVSPST